MGLICTLSYLTGLLKKDKWKKKEVRMCHCSEKVVYRYRMIFINGMNVWHEQYSSSTVKFKNLQFPLDFPIDRLWHPPTLLYRVMVQKTWSHLMSMSQVQASHLPDVSRSIKCGAEAGLHISPATLVLSFFLGPAQDSIWIFCTFFLHQIIGERGDLQVSNVGKFNELLSNASESKVPTYTVESL